MISDTSFKMTLRGCIPFAALLAVSQSVASEPPQVADCEEPVYSLDLPVPRPETHLELGIMSYRECLLHVIDTGSPEEIRKARIAMQQILLDQQRVWPLIEVVDKAQSQGLWTEDRMAAALSVRKDWGTHIYVVLTQSNSDSLVVDITPIEYGLLGKLGIPDRSQYERYETEPVEWLEVTDDYFLLNVRLRAWRDGQRYTVFGPVHIKADGIVVWQ